MAYDPNSTHNTYDPTEDMNGPQRFLAGMGKAFHDPYLRLKQATGSASQADVDEAAQRDKALLHTAGGLGGNIAGYVAQAVPMAAGVGALGGAAGLTGGALTAAGAAGTGALQGAMAPVTTGSSALGNTAGGAAAGLLGQGIASGLQGLVRPAVKYATPQIAKLAQKASDLGVPLSADQITGSPVGKALAKLFGNMPGGNAAKLAQTQNDAYTKALTSTFGPPSADGVAAVANAKTALGANYKALSARNHMFLSRNDVDALDAIPLTHLAHTGSSSQQAELETVINNIKDQSGIGDAANGVLSGTEYQGLRSAMGKNAAALPPGSPMQNSWNKVQGVLDNAMREGLPDADKALWNQTDKQYAAMKTVERALPVSGENFTTGAVVPSKMMSTMNSSANKNAANKAAMQQDLGTSPLADAAKVGNSFVPPPPTTEIGGHSIPYGDVVKAMGPAAVQSMGGAGLGAAASHFAPDDSLLHKHPFYAAAAGAAGTTALGTTLGKFLLSQGYKNGIPAVDSALEAMSKYGVPASAASGSLKAANSYNGPQQTASSKAAEKDPFAGMEEVKPGEAADPFAGAQEVAAPPQQ